MKRSRERSRERIVLIRDANDVLAKDREIRDANDESESVKDRADPRSRRFVRDPRSRMVRERDREWFESEIGNGSRPRS